MRFWAGVTDGDWYRALSAQPGIDEVNFWQPSTRKKLSGPPEAGRMPNPEFLGRHAEGRWSR